MVIDSILVAHFSFVLFVSFTSRKHKRYYYTNNDTQESQWDFPAEDLKAKVPELSQATSSVVSMATTMTTAMPTSVMPTTMAQAAMNVATPMVQTWNTSAGIMAVPMMPMASVSHATTMPVIGKVLLFVSAFAPHLWLNIITWAYLSSSS